MTGARPRPPAGFTLLEVLVALAVIAIGLGAVLAAAGQATRTTAHLRDHAAALWVADNRATELELAGSAASEELVGEADMLGRTWYWRQRAEAMQAPGMLRVEVAVFERRPGVSAGGGEPAPLVRLHVYLRAGA